MNSLPDAVSEGLIFAAIYLPLLLIADYYFGNIVYSLAYFLELFLQLGVTAAIFGWVMQRFGSDTCSTGLSDVDQQKT